MTQATLEKPLDGQSIQQPDEAAPSWYELYERAKFAAPGKYTDKDRDKIPPEDFAGPDQTFPIVVPKDVHDAARLHGHADDPAAVKSKIISIAKRKGSDFVAQLPKDWKPGDKEERLADPSATATLTANFFVPITRADAAKREVEGVMTSEAVDSYGTVFDYDSMKRAIERWRGNIREQHDSKLAVGKKVFVTYDDEARKVWLRAMISEGAPNTWKKVEEGILTGFSIGACNARKTDRRVIQTEDGRSKTVPVFLDYDLAEVSLVDAPSNPDAADSGLAIYRSAAFSASGQDESSEDFAVYEDLLTVDRSQEPEAEPPAEPEPSEERSETPAEPPLQELADRAEAPEMPAAPQIASSQPVTQVTLPDITEEDLEQMEARTQNPDSPAPEQDISLSVSGQKQVAFAELMRSVDDQMLQDKGQAHDEHTHPHSSSYGDSHDHSHDHTHKDGTAHSHPHMHSHDHHEHYGDEDHSHPHTHNHEHDHYFRLTAPDLQRDQVPQPDESAPSWFDLYSIERAKKAAAPKAGDEDEEGGKHQDSEAGKKKPVSAGEDASDIDNEAEDGSADDGDEEDEEEKKRAITTETGLVGHDLSSPAQVAVPGATRAHGGPGCTCSGDCSCPAGCSCDKCKDCALTRAAAPEETRAGARISGDTKKQIHAARDQLLLTCSCDECKDCMEAAGGADPDMDGDDDSTPEGDTDQDYQKRVLTRSAKLQRIKTAQIVRSVAQAAVQSIIEQEFKPIEQRLRQVTARLTTVQEPDLSRVADQLGKVESSLGDLKGLVEKIAAQEMPGVHPVLKPADKPPTPFSQQRAVLDASAPEVLSPAQMAEAYQVLRSQGLLRSQEAQVGAAADIIRRSLPN